MQYTDIEFSVVSESCGEIFACLESLHSAMGSNTSYSWTLTVTCGVDAEQRVAARVHGRYPHGRMIESPAVSEVSNSHGSVLRASHARYVWLLNDDVVFLAGAIDKVIAFMDRPENSRVAVVGPQLLNPDGLLTLSGYGVPSMKRILLQQAGVDGLEAIDALKHWMPSLGSTLVRPGRRQAVDRNQEVDTLPGVCVVLRSKAVRQAGLMLDPAPVRSAETEWHRRFRDNGWKVMLFVEASVIHYGNQSVRADLRHLRPEHLKGAIYFFRTGRSPAGFRMFCASVVALASARAALGWLRRDRTVAGVARRHARVAWEGLIQG